MTRRLILALCAAALVLPGPARAAAVSDLTNDEVALVTLDPSGLPSSATLVSRISSTRGPARTVLDPASTTNVSYLDRSGAPATTSGGVLVEVGDGTTVLTEAQFDRPLPVAMHAQYMLDGRVVDPARVLGATGDITITYSVTNTTVQEERIVATDAGGESRSTLLPVFVPFAGTLVVTVPRGMTVVRAPGAASATDAQGATVLRFDLLLAPPAGGFTSESTVQLRAEQGASTPGVVMAVAPVTGRQNPALGFAGELLDQSAAGSQELARGLDQLDGGVGQLADGALALAAGAAELAAGQSALTRAIDGGAAGAGAAADGSQVLVDGLTQVAAGLQALSGPTGLAAAAQATDGLAAGAALLADIVGSADDGPWAPRVVLPSNGWPPGVPPWPPSADDIPEWADAIEALPVVLQHLGFAPDGRPRDDVCELDVDGDGLLDDPVTDIDCVPTLVQSLRLLSQAAGLAAQVSAAIPGLLAAAGADLAEATSAADHSAAVSAAAAAAAASLLQQVCGADPVIAAEQCGSLEAVARDADAAAASSQSAAASIAAAGPDLAEAGVRAAGLAAGLPLLAGLLQGTTSIAEQVGAGLRSDSAAEPGLAEGLASLRQGLLSASTASSQLASGAAVAQSGAAQLADGSGLLADGLQRAAAGSGELASGTAQLGAGAESLAAGAERLRADGTSAALSAVIDGSADAATVAAYLAATDARAGDGLPYGAPAGATGNAAYVLDMPATSAANGPAPWAALLLFVVVSLGFAGALLRRRTAA